MINLDWTILVQFVNFILILLILHRLVFKPVLSAIKERDDYFSNMEIDIKEKLSRYKDMVAKYESMVKDLNIETRLIVEKAREETQRESAKIIDKARESLAKDIEKGKDQLKLDIANVEKELDLNIPLIASMIASKVAKVD